MIDYKKIVYELIDERECGEFDLSSPTSTKFVDVDIGSMELLSLILDAEDKLDIDIENNLYLEMITIQDLIDAVKSKHKGTR